MHVRILTQARRDLLEGYEFYERQSPGLGDYFLTNLYSEIDSLPLYAGIHEVVLGYHPALSEKFPFGIYYSVQGEDIIVHAVLDGCRDSSRIRGRLEG